MEAFNQLIKSIIFRYAITIWYLDSVERKSYEYRRQECKYSYLPYI